MALLMAGLWQLATVVVILSHISASLPSLESSRILNPRHERQIELKLMHDAGMRREYEKAAKLLQNLMNYKRSVSSGVKEASGFTDKNTDDLWSSEEKLIKLKTCLQFVQNLDASFSENDAEDASQRVSRLVCQLIAGINEAVSGAIVDENQE